MAETEVGKITHVFGKIGVGVIELTKTLNVGDTIKIKGHDREFEQQVASMQVDHAPVEKAEKGQSVGLKFDEEIKDGDMVYKG
jgi:selenocysteine-specific translation elongation factor